MVSSAVEVRGKCVLGLDIMTEETLDFRLADWNADAEIWHLEVIICSCVGANFEALVPDGVKAWGALLRVRRRIAARDSHRQALWQSQTNRIPVLEVDRLIDRGVLQSARPMVDPSGVAVDFDLLSPNVSGYASVLAPLHPIRLLRADHNPILARISDVETDTHRTCLDIVGGLWFAGHVGDPNLLGGFAVDVRRPVCTRFAPGLVEVELTRCRRSFVPKISVAPCLHASRELIWPDRVLDVNGWCSRWVRWCRHARATNLEERNVLAVWTTALP